MQVSQQIKFPHAPNADFFPTLRQRINQYFQENQVSKNGNWTLYLKTIVLYCVYVGSFIAIMTLHLPGWAMLLLCVSMGFGASGLGMNVMHDALHNSYSKYTWVNRLVGVTMEILGGSSVNWKIQHNMMHHTYTNVYGMDEDIDDKTMLRLSPDGQLRWYHRFQHYYATLLYGLSNLSWLMHKDFVKFGAYWKEGKLKQLGVKPTTEAVKLYTFKGLFFFTTIILPMFVLDVAWYWVPVGFALMQFVSGLTMTWVFLTAHAVEEADHFLPDGDGNMENNWAIHQLTTTCNFKTSKPLNWYVGGLNHQIEHHLFPGISHIHYPNLSPIVRKTAEEFGLPYREYTSFGAALLSHYKYLRDIGQNRPGEHHSGPAMA